MINKIIRARYYAAIFCCYIVLMNAAAHIVKFLFP
jgi:hypothetical protein